MSCTNLAMVLPKFAWLISEKVIVHSLSETLFVYCTGARRLVVIVLSP